MWIREKTYDQLVQRIASLESTVEDLRRAFDARTQIQVDTGEKSYNWNSAIPYPVMHKVSIVSALTDVMNHIGVDLVWEAGTPAGARLKKVVKK